VEDDEMLMSAVAGGDQDALRVLYERHAPVMLRLVRRLTQNQGVAEECLQESWLAVWQSAASFRGEASVRSWLLGVARRQSHNRLRKNSVATVELNESTDVADLTPGVEEQVLAGAQAAELAGAVRTLPEHLREVLVLVLVEELSYQDVGAALEIPVGTVKSRMSHARRRLAAVLTSTSERVGDR
jgi:RNA polymerase sigma factor (sigma-70 family)